MTHLHNSFAGTTRLPRDGEVNGVDYTFVSLEEFRALERTGNLLESGEFDGALSITPRPPQWANRVCSQRRQLGAVGVVLWQLEVNPQRPSPALSLPPSHSRWWHTVTATTYNRAVRPSLSINHQRYS